MSFASAVALLVSIELIWHNLAACQVHQSLLCTAPFSPDNSPLYATPPPNTNQQPGPQTSTFVLNGDCRVYFYSDSACTLDETPVTTIGSIAMVSPQARCRPLQCGFSCSGTSIYNSTTSSHYCLRTGSLCHLPVACFRWIEVTMPPTNGPTSPPSSLPTFVPTTAPSSIPSFVPSVEPTAAPTKSPSTIPSAAPSVEPTSSPSTAPTVLPTNSPTRSPTDPACLTRDFFISSPGTVVGRYGEWANEGPHNTPLSRRIPTLDIWMRYNNTVKAWEIQPTLGIARYRFPAVIPPQWWPPQGNRQWIEVSTGNPVMINLQCVSALSEAVRAPTVVEQNIQKIATESGVYVFIVGVIGITVALVLAKVSENRNRGGDKLGSSLFALPLYFLQVLDIFTDLLFATFLYARGATNLFYASVTFILLPWLLGAGVLMRYILFVWADDELIRHWLKNYDKMLVLLYIPSGSFTRVVALVNSKIFYSPTFDMGVRTRDLDEMARFRLIPILLENLPQLIVQIAYYRLYEETQEIVVIAFCVTSLSFITSFMMGLVHFRHRYAPYEEQDLFQHFFIQIDCSHPRPHYRCSRKKVSEAMARFIFEGRYPERVEVYDSDVDLKAKRIYFAGVIAWPGTQEEFDKKFNEDHRSLLATHLRNFLDLNQSVSATISGMSSESQKLPRARSIRSHMGVRATKGPQEFGRSMTYDEEMMMQGGPIRLKSQTMSEVEMGEQDVVPRSSRRFVGSLV